MVDRVRHLLQDVVDNCHKPFTSSSGSGMRSGYSVLIPLPFVKGDGDFGTPRAGKSPLAPLAKGGMSMPPKTE